jgi:hypothetical protein
MLKHHSVRVLYRLALAEGEGMGTAYEYYVKRLALDRFFVDKRRPRSILVAGLPEKYGASLDFLLLGGELGASVTVIDDRLAALHRLRDALEALKKMPYAPPLPPTPTILKDELSRLSAVTQQYDLVVSSEVLQRLTPTDRSTYIDRIRSLSGHLALFCPNADNKAHNVRSGLAGLRLQDMKTIVADGRESTVGYIDMPPFPPGVTRSAQQREEATQGRFEGFVMWGLTRYAHMERFVPLTVRRQQSHIVFAFTSV